MTKKIKTLSYIYWILILCTFISGSTTYAETVTPQIFNDSIISMSVAEYRAYLKNNPPLDRLFREGESLFFLVEHSQLKKVEACGVKILSNKPAPIYNATATPAEGSQINGAYHTYNETNTLLRDLATRFPDLATVTTIGHSIEGRELNVIKISDNVANDEKATEPNIFICGCHHAREWISVEVPLLFAKHLLESYSGNTAVRNAVNGAQIYIQPIVNPDGLEFSIHTYRMWRKNRRYNGDFSWGIDPNRNYGYMWGLDDEGSSPNPYSYTYRGTGPFSEPETDTVRQFLLANPPNGALTFHNYGLLLLYPWGHKYEAPADIAQFSEMAGEMADRIYQVNGRVYDHGGSEALYLVNGSTVDWIYGTFGVPAFTVELPPDSLYEGGFVTPEELIDSAFSEQLPAMMYFVDYFITGTGNNETTHTTTPKKTAHSKKREHQQ